MRPDVSQTPYDTSTKENTGNIITLTQFDKGNLLSETNDDDKSGDEFDDNSIMAPLISEEEMDAMDSGDESEDEPMSTEMLGDISGGIQSHLSVNMREEHYKYAITLNKE